jgi:hypothetical protein
MTTPFGESLHVFDESLMTRRFPIAQFIHERSTWRLSFTSSFHRSREESLQFLVGAVDTSALALRPVSLGF